jgi:hypothetical protein
MVNVVLVVAYAHFRADNRASNVILPDVRETGRNPNSGNRWQLRRPKVASLDGLASSEFAFPIPRVIQEKEEQLHTHHAL